jgi:hypothetical protein
MTPYEFKITEGKQESGMFQQNASGPSPWRQPMYQQGLGDPWPWPTHDSRVQSQVAAANVEVTSVAGDSQPKSLDFAGFDSEAHRAFMRSLG